MYFVPIETKVFFHVRQVVTTVSNNYLKLYQAIPIYLCQIVSPLATALFSPQVSKMQNCNL